MGSSDPRAAILRIWKTLSRQDARLIGNLRAQKVPLSAKAASGTLGVCCIADTLWSVERRVRSGGGAGSTKQGRRGSEVCARI